VSEAVDSLSEIIKIVKELIDKGEIDIVDGGKDEYI
jgi:hypothetical protein